MSTEVDLDEAQRLCDQASPGPWISNGEHEYIPAMATKAVMIRTLTDEPNWPRPAMARQTNDAEFIAAARSLMPALIADIREADYVCRVTGEKLTAVKEQRDAAEAALTRVRTVAAKPWNAFAGRDVLLDAVRAAVGTTPDVTTDLTSAAPNEGLDIEVLTSGVPNPSEPTGWESRARRA